VIDVGHLIADLSAQVLPPSPKNCMRQPTNPARYGAGLHWSLEANQAARVAHCHNPIIIQAPA